MRSRLKFPPNNKKDDDEQHAEVEVELDLLLLLLEPELELELELELGCELFRGGPAPFSREYFFAATAIRDSDEDKDENAEEGGKGDELELWRTVPRMENSEPVEELPDDIVVWDEVFEAEENVNRELEFEFVEQEEDGEEVRDGVSNGRASNGLSERSVRRLNSCWTMRCCLTSPKGFARQSRSSLHRVSARAVRDRKSSSDLDGDGDDDDTCIDDAGPR